MDLKPNLPLIPYYLLYAYLLCSTLYLPTQNSVPCPPYTHHIHTLHATILQHTGDKTYNLFLLR